MKPLIAAFVAAAFAFGSMPMATAQMHRESHTKSGSETHKGTGVVTNVDRGAGRVTLRHEPIQSLKWPAMTMAFNVKDSALLDKAQKDKKVEFEFVQQDKRYVIISIK